MPRLPFLTEAIRSKLLVVLALVLIAGAAFGIIFWALQGSLIGVALSALLPAPGAVWMLTGTRASGVSDADHPGRNPRT
jgi:hypothetical protein